MDAEQTMPLDVWVASIPITEETRNYVQRVLAAQVVYEWRYTGEVTRRSGRNTSNYG